MTKSMKVMAIVVSVVSLSTTLQWIVHNGVVHVDRVDYSEDYKDQREKELIIAVVEGNAERIQQLATQGVNLNAVGSYENTPMKVALQLGQIKSILSLLNLGVSPNFKTPAGVAAAKVAITSQKDPKLLKVLFDFGLDPNLKSEGAPLIFFAVSEGHWLQYDLLLAKGADVNSRNTNGSPLLLDLVMQMEYDRAKDLLLKGADFRVKSMHGLNVLDELLDYQSRLCGEPDLPDCHKRAALLKLLQQRGATVPPGLPYM